MTNEEKHKAAIDYMTNLERNEYKLLIEPSQKVSQEKYYTPSIEDIRVGYECEFQIDKKNDRWRPFIFRKSDLFECPICNGEKVNEKDCELRTPYLTKEQIEGEGWKSIIIGRFGVVGCYRREVLNDGENFEGFDMYILHENKIRILRYSADIHSGGGETIVYEGKCPSINEFRFINKLLGI